MKTKSDFYIRKKDKANIDTLAERLNREKETLIGRIISWEDFTTTYMLYMLPETDLERMYWVNRRPIWVEMLNKAFAKRKYPCRIYVTRENTSGTRGVSLLINGSAAAVKSMGTRLNRITNKIFVKIYFRYFIILIFTEFRPNVIWD